MRSDYQTIPDTEAEQPKRNKSSHSWVILVGICCLLAGALLSFRSSQAIIFESPIGAGKAKGAKSKPAAAAPVAGLYPLTDAQYTLDTVQAELTEGNTGATADRVRREYEAGKIKNLGYAAELEDQEDAKLHEGIANTNCHAWAYNQNVDDYEGSSHAATLAESKGLADYLRSSNTEEVSNFDDCDYIVATRDRVRGDNSVIAHTMINPKSRVALRDPKVAAAWGAVTNKDDFAQPCVGKLNEGMPVVLTECGLWNNEPTQRVHFLKLRGARTLLHLQAQHP